MTTTNKKDILGTIALSTFGVNLVITKENGAYDHAAMRVAQLDALTSILHGGGFNTFQLYAESVQDNVLWLVHELAHEIKELLPIVCEEARAHGVYQEQQAALKEGTKEPFTDAYYALLDADRATKDQLNATKDQRGQDAKAD